jgi:hypothetical protein
MTVKVTVCCSFYNRKNYVKATIDSLLSQDYDCFEIIVINDGSEEDIKTILDSYHDNRLKIVHQDNIGFVRSIRKAIDMSKGDYIAIQGAGDISFPGRLRKQVEFLEKNPEYVVVGCAVRNYNIKNGKGKIIYHNSFIEIGDSNIYTHGEVMFRKKAYLDVGGYRTFFKYAQDRDLWLRLSTIGKLGSINELLYQRNIFDDGVSNVNEKTIIQTVLSDIALESYRKVKGGKKDLIEEYGEFCLLFKPKSKRLSIKLTILGIRAALKNDRYLSKNCFQLAFAEKEDKISLFNIIWYPLLRFFIVFPNITVSFIRFCFKNKIYKILPKRFSDDVLFWYE